MARIPNQAPIGSLLDKKSRSKRVRPDAPGQRKPRMRDEEYLALVRQIPCLRCGRGPSQAAHVRTSAPGEYPIGGGIKPDDSRVLPLCQWCHLDAPDAQHKVGERNFYGELSVDPLLFAKKLYAAKPDLAVMKWVVNKARRRFA